MADNAKLEQLREHWNTLTPEEQKLLKIELAADMRAKETRAQFDAHKEVLEGLGYELWSHNVSWNWATFSKNVLADEPSLHVKLYKESGNSWRAEISYSCRAIRVTSGDFSFPHPDFERVFESQVRKAATAIELHGGMYDG